MRKPGSLGFTLIELLISAAIIGVISSIVLAKYGSFDSSVLLKGVGYDIALSLRDAQVKSVSVVRGVDGFDFPYGIHFAPGKTYIAFRYTDPSAYPSYDGSVHVDPLLTQTIGRTMQIAQVCVKIGNAAYDCSPTKLDVSFRRPEFKALFATNDDTAFPPASIDSAIIKVNTTNGNIGTYDVVVTSFGQISVIKE